MRKYLVLLASLLLFLSCSTSKSEHQEDPDAVVHHPLYAKGFDILEHYNYLEIILFNPWNYSEILARYYLVGNDSTSTPDDGMRVRIPVDNVAITSVTQIEFLNLIGELNSIKASCSPELIYNEELKSLYQSGGLTSLGDAFHLNTEQLIALNSDVVFATLYNQSSVQQQLADAGIARMVYDNEWTESSPLARAEWIKFIAAFYGKLDIADSLFAELDSSYQQTSLLPASVAQPKSILVGGNYRGTWYMPGGQSYMGTLLKDAHADYKYANDTTTGSLSLNFETVLHEFSGVEVWLNAPAKTLGEMKSMDERHSLFAPFSSGEVYGFYNRLTDTGANDFWESGVAHPDIILKDLIWALYPELLSEYEPVYIIKCGT